MATSCFFIGPKCKKHSPLGAAPFEDKPASDFLKDFESLKAKLPQGKQDQDVCQLDDYLEREYPEISSGQQSKPIFIPDCFISKVPKVVDYDKESWEQLGDAEEVEKMKKKRVDIDGDEAEHKLFSLLHNFFSTSGLPDKQTVVFHSFQDNYIGKLELDFLIINEDHKLIIAINCKYSGSKANTKKSVCDLQG